MIQLNMGRLFRKEDLISVFPCPSGVFPCPPGDRPVYDSDEKRTAGDRWDGVPAPGGLAGSEIILEDTL